MNEKGRGEERGEWEEGEEERKNNNCSFLALLTMPTLRYCVCAESFKNKYAWLVPWHIGRSERKLVRIYKFLFSPSPPACTRLNYRDIRRKITSVI